jgi:hypothetical protein
MSAGIILIRYLSLPMVKREAERQVDRHLAAAYQDGIGRGVVLDGQAMSVAEPVSIHLYVVAPDQ